MAQHNVQGLSIVNSADDWAGEIEKYSDPEYYAQCSEALRQYSRKHCLAENYAGDFIELIENSNTTSDHEDITALSKAS